jgi:hypothetical protein
MESFNYSCEKREWFSQQLQVGVYYQYRGILQITYNHTLHRNPARTCKRIDFNLDLLYIVLNFLSRISIYMQENDFSNFFCRFLSPNYFFQFEL